MKIKCWNCGKIYRPAITDTIESKRYFSTICPYCCSNNDKEFPCYPEALEDRLGDNGFIPLFRLWFLPDNLTKLIFFCGTLGGNYSNDKCAECEFQSTCETTKQVNEIERILNERKEM